MIADDADAITVTFHRMMRAAVAAERPGEGTLGRTVELARAWGDGPAADVALAAALRRLHGDEPAGAEPSRSAATDRGVDGTADRRRPA
ncbi:hypothetical protein [Micromonospora sp. NPDC092111]|uniref:hypothetical protein n=1 Tax=Micromonospora sp. NPDC092111 TaxID=3364289 RepID=UPI003802F479